MNPIEQAPETVEVFGMTFRKKGSPHFEFGHSSQEYEHEGVKITRTFDRLRECLVWRAIYERGTQGVLYSVPASDTITASPEKAFRSMVAAAERQFKDLEENHQRVMKLLAAGRMQVANLKALTEGYNKNCDPKDACVLHGRCWPHSEWENPET